MQPGAGFKTGDFVKGKWGWEYHKATTILFWPQFLITIDSPNNTSPGRFMGQRHSNTIHSHSLPMGDPWISVSNPSATHGTRG